MNKCACGKTKDKDGNCDGSHSNKIINFFFNLRFEL